MSKLTERTLRTMKANDTPLTDDIVKGLRAVPTPSGIKWILRFTSPVTGARRDAGAGTFPEVSLADARERAQAMRKQIADGKDPIEERNRERAAAAREANVPTFGHAAKQVHTDLKAGWKQTKNVLQWLASVEQHLAPILARRVDTLTPADFADALRAEWLKHPRATADVLQRASVIMRWCFAKGFVMADPTSLVRSLLAKQQTEVEHHPALPYHIAPAFIAQHFATIAPTDVPRAAMFVLIHTACRPGEVRGMRWSELDLDSGVWTIPATRMKGKAEHRVPLVHEVVTLLRRISELKLHDDYVFPNSRGTNPISDVRLQEWLQDVKAPSDVTGRFATPHGCRAMFKDWAIESGHSESTSERALAHKVKGQVKQAYERTTQFERRTHLMRAWASYLHGHTVDNVVSLSTAA
ncbi:Integrase [Burkholderia diffusa]|uniref:tyrosine-type recombinase/integrase n=1 Tax=Burkholderia diffusa TaxID=488732 RepID=UPI001CB2544E|nr:site-specific integrase [Burkholderia diffusa]CAG9265689.1 Integrase [Burkholderia diffusa]